MHSDMGGRQDGDGEELCDHLCLWTLAGTRVFC